MTALRSDTQAAGPVEFSTDDPALAVAHFESAYGTSVQVTHLRDGGFTHSRLDGGSFALDDLRLPTLAVRQEPYHKLIIVRLHAGRAGRECGGIAERFVPGDIYISAEPSLPSTLRLFDTHGKKAVLDLAVLAQVAATSTSRASSPLRFTGLQPVSSAAAEHWKQTVDYLGQLLANPQAATQPLIRGSAARLLAATALATFPNTALTEPTALDRRDATPVTVLRATAFIEEHPDRDVSVADIAAAANVSIRAVQVAFRRHFDTTPMQYLRDVRLDHVHRELLTADPTGGVTVTDIATRWGFYNHSRFAARYRRAYGVTPRATLRYG